jgi:hypothetical protein
MRSNGVIVLEYWNAEKSFFAEDYLKPMSLSIILASFHYSITPALQF